MAKEKPTRPSDTKSQAQITIEVPQGMFPVVFYANTIGVETIDGHKLIHFGLLLPPSRLLGGWACILENRLIEFSKESWMKYLNEVELPSSEVETTFRCPPEKLPQGVPSVNMAALSRTGELGEVRLFSYSMGDVLEDRRVGKTGKIKGQPIALIRLPLELQKQLIVSIYGELIS